jgi:hypothetical protein
MKFGFLSKYFPPEKFLKPPYVGISFSDSSIKAIYFDKEAKNSSLKSLIVPLEKDAVINGSIANIEEIIKKLSIIRKDFDLPFVFFTMPDELAYVFSTSVLVASGSDATENVAFIMEENVPLQLISRYFLVYCFHPLNAL